jgi:hypothetical protein
MDSKEIRIQQTPSEEEKLEEENDYGGIAPLPSEMIADVVRCNK